MVGEGRPSTPSLPADELAAAEKVVDARNKCGHDDRVKREFP
jgi:hypothetical protein